MNIDGFAGFGIKGFRSFGFEDVQYVGPIDKIHLLVGKNNVGKSNVLDFACDVLMSFKKNGLAINNNMFGMDIDIPQDDDWDKTSPRVISIGLRLSNDVLTNFKVRDDDPASRLEPMLRTNAFSHADKDIVWFDFIYGKEPGEKRLQPDFDQFRKALAEAGIKESIFMNVVSNLTGGSGPLDHNCVRLIGSWQPWLYIPEIVKVEIKRGITDGSDPINSRTNGKGLIGELAKLQSPELANYKNDKNKFNALNGFLRDVLEDEAACIEIPDSKDTILVHTKSGEILPLNRLGTGIEAIVFIAAIVTYQSNKLICIEEPELYLHPSLQRKLIEYLAENTSNRYLMSTHSASILNANISSISHLTKEKWTKVDNVASPTELSNAVMDLGNRASDILQSNFIVWVEGPSDRLYISDWLRKFDDELVEGAHFTIMFYGGGLLSQLAVDDNAEDLINLLKINRNLAIVIDSDKKSAEGVLNATKTRVIEEVNSMGAMSWVTEGYTIENYIPQKIIQEAVNIRYPNKTYKIASNMYSSPIGKKFKDAESKPDKVAIARDVIGLGVDLGEFSVHLQDNIKKIANEIRKANGLVQED